MKCFRHRTHTFKNIQYDPLGETINDLLFDTIEKIEIPYDDLPADTKKMIDENTKCSCEEEENEMV